jgi:hypothetical protein
VSGVHLQGQAHSTLRQPLVSFHTGKITRDKIKNKIHCFFENDEEIFLKGCSLVAGIGVRRTLLAVRRELALPR